MSTRFFCFVVFVWVPAIAAACSLLADEYADQIIAARPGYQLAMFYGFLVLMFSPFLWRVFVPRNRRGAR